MSAGTGSALLLPGATMRRDVVRCRSCVAKLRVAAGLSLEQLSRRSGLSKSQVFRIERGYSVPTVLAAMTIARALRSTVADLRFQSAE